METLLSLYDPAPSPLLDKLLDTPPLQRLAEVGMNCGCEYTAFPLFARTLPYSRRDHSAGAARIVWHFTASSAQAAAALLHDAATPVFAHTVDFLHGDHLRQESTEADTAAVIAASPEVMAVLAQYGLDVTDVGDYHRYPVADNDSPRLSADRLEYTLGNLFHYGFEDLPRLTAFYRDLTVSAGEDGQPELAFRTPAIAEDFALAALRTGRVYVCDEDRFAMEALASLLRDALDRRVLSPADLMGTEPAVIAKLRADTVSGPAWECFRRFHAIRTAVGERPEKGWWVRVDAKRRWIDPLAVGRGRVSAWSPVFREALTSFLALDFTRWLSGIETEERPG